MSDSDPTGTAVSYGYASDGLKGRLISYNGKNLSGYNAQPYSYYGTPLVYFDHKSTTSYWEMTWNGRVLKTMQKKNINGITSSESISFRYDSENIRINKIVNGSQIDYIYVGSDLIREKRGDIDITYIYGLDGVIGFEYKEADGQVSRYYYLKNIQGDVTNILDNNGNIIVKYAYDAWGNHKVLNASGVENTSDDFIGNINPIRYRGYYYDKETNLYYLISRYYDPEIGRFISPDHIGYALIGVTEPNGLNLYAYCLNNPIKYIDSTGKSVVAILLILGIATIIGGVVGGKIAYDKAVEEGKTGADLFLSTLGGVFIGGAIGLAIGGVIVMFGAAAAGAASSFGLGSGTFLGVKAAEAFAIGALAFDFTAFFVAPIIGIDMQGVEFNTGKPIDSRSVYENERSKICDFYYI